MSQERYEIRGKIGQGGVGTVYKAFDTQLNREVAIKRVLADGSDDADQIQTDATKQLLKEATALSSVQHPHIVTVYDAGMDSDGPYVVMELIHGKTLDEMVEQATLTWDDLREIALQTQEALIAAQDLDLVHRDLKPSNVMVCWLPSGKFQVKIVDFGLAKFSATPSLQTIDHGDAVFGSIFFMAPEQFERTPLDQRTDMYAMGCLYYFALTGQYPFNGDTAAQVMASHLQHSVPSLAEVRPDIPAWGAEWIMWHIERSMDDRPHNAREALERFLILDKQSTQPITASAAPVTAAAAAGSPQLIFPTSAANEAEAPAAPTPAANPLTAQPQPMQAPAAAQPQTIANVGGQAVALQPSDIPTPTTAPQPMRPPGSGINPHTNAQKLSQQATQAVTSSAEPETTPQAIATTTPATQPTTAAPTVQPTAPVEPAASPLQAATAQPTSAPQLQTGTPQISINPNAQPAAAQGINTTPKSPAHGLPAAQLNAPGQAVGATANTQENDAAQQAPLPAKKSMSSGAKWAIIGILSLIIIVAGIVGFGMMKQRGEIEMVNNLLTRAKALHDEGNLQDGIEVEEKELRGLLKRVTSAQEDENRALLLKTLAYVTAKGGYDANKIILDHMTTVPTRSNIRTEVFKAVMTRRKDVGNISPLLEFAKLAENDEAEPAAAAIQAAHASAVNQPADEYIKDFLGLISETDSSTVRGAAEKAAADLIAQSKSKSSFVEPIQGAYETAINDAGKFAMLRLLGATGGSKAAATVTEALKSSNVSSQSAALAALGNWADDSQFDTLIEFIESTNSDSLRRKSFDAAYSFLRSERKRDPEDLGDMWKNLAGIAKSQQEKLQIIRGMANQSHEWAIPVLEYFIDDKDDKVIDQAERAKQYVERKLQEKNSSS